MNVHVYFTTRFRQAKRLHFIQASSCGMQFASNVWQWCKIRSNCRRADTDSSRKSYWQLQTQIYLKNTPRYKSCYRVNCILKMIYVLYSKLANKRDSEFGEHIPVQNKVKVVRSMTRWMFGFIRWNETEENRRGYRHAPVFVSDERFHCHDGTCYSRIRWTKITQWPSAKSNDLFLNAVK